MIRVKCCCIHFAIVYIGHKEVAVYQDDSCKPPQGEGLNKMATITLENTWPLDKTTRQQIKVVIVILQTLLRYGNDFIGSRQTTGDEIC